MARRLFSALVASALALCAGRVAAYASPTADAHACCRAQKGTAPAVALVDCCPVAAVAAAPAFVARLLVAPAHAAPAPVLVVAFVPALSAPASPPGPRAYRAASPARAPPLG